ncbi:MAG: hypothetical protein AB7C97_09590 [Oscillospiraceae bacterium]
MATISASSNEKIYQIKKWLGINQCPDGDTDLKNGEAAVMKNFRITADGALQVRPGTKTIAELRADAPVRGLWTGYVGGDEVMVAACDGKLWLVDPDAGTDAVEIGEITTTQRVHMFGFSEKLYIMNGTQYKVWNGETLADVAGYRPLVVTASVPSGGGAALEQVNKLCGLRRVRFSPTGTATEFKLTETGLASIDYVKNTVTGEDYTPDTDYSARTEYGNVVFARSRGTERFTGNGSQTVFTLSSNGDSVTGVTVGGENTTFYTYNSSNRTITFSSAPAEDAEIVVSETVTVAESFTGTGSQTVFTLSGEAMTVTGVTVGGSSTTAYTTSKIDKTVTFGTAPGDGTAIVITGTTVPSAGTETFTGTGTQKAFTLSDKNVNVSGVTVDGSGTAGYTYSLADGTITFGAAPESGAVIVVFATVTPIAGTNTIEIGYTYPEDDRDTVLTMRFSETYNGTTDSRVFLYGDGTNQTLYSGLETDGSATAEYFPDLNVMHVGDENTPVTAMIRHYNRLLVFKEDSTYSVCYDTITLADSTVTAGFYLTTVNKSTGNCAPGQAVLVDNHPRTFDGNTLYEWRATSTSGNITGDQRNAKRISDRIEKTLEDFTLSEVTAYNDKFNHEYYAVQGGTAVVNNYRNDTWYIYEDFPAVCMADLNGEIYFGTDTGTIRHVSRDHRGDDGVAISARWESGAMPFGADFRRKYAAMLWIGVKPESATKLSVTLQTDTKNDFATKVIERTRATLLFTDFANWSFATNRRPYMSRIKLKAKKFTFYKLIFTSDTINTTATVVSADIRVRYAGNVR